MAIQEELRLAKEKEEFERLEKIRMEEEKQKQVFWSVFWVFSGLSSVFTRIFFLNF